nr:reverse transcriptase [Tanacetum cinerariifolium]
MEVVNRCLESYLRAFVRDEPRTWNKYLYLAEFWYNTSFHSSIKMTPFKAVYGREATTIHDYSPGTNKTASIDATLVEHQRLISVLKEALEHTRQRMTEQANKKRMEKQIQVGELVYLRLRNYRQQSVAARDNLKLSKRYFGLYRILEKVGHAAYRLEFHVSLLKEIHQEQEPSSEFPTKWLTNSPSLEPQPENILQRRITGNKEEVLVKWKHHDTSEATWEDWLEFMHRFLVFVGHEDMSSVQGKTNDTPEPSAAVQTKAAQDKARPTRIIKKPARYLE